MAKRRTNQAVERATKKAARSSGQQKSSGESTYAKKRDWCAKNGKWGFEVLDPKPWK